MVNLECPLSCEGLQATAKLGLGQNLFGSEDALQFLKELGINLVGIANNHMFDFGSEGVVKTHECLLSQKISFIGSPLVMKNIPEIKTVDLDGEIKVGFWAAFLNAEPTDIGSTGVELATVERAKKALLNMSINGNVKCRIALIHAGLEKTFYPDPHEARVLHKFIECGFDIVVVCHSHRISGYSKILNNDNLDPRFCFYGLGSLLSGCIYGDPEREGIIVVAGLDQNGRLAELEVRSVWLDGPGWGVIPDQNCGQRVLDRFEQISSSIQNRSYEKKFYDEINQNFSRRLLRDFLAVYQIRGFSGVFAKLNRIQPKHLKRLLNKITW